LFDNTVQERFISIFTKIYCFQLRINLEKQF
jgi:hypothetical protein